MSDKKIKKPKKSPAPEMMWTVKIETKLKILTGAVREILSGIRSSDRPTRKMSVVFLMSLAALCGVVSFMVVRAVHLRRLALAQRTPEQSAAAKSFDAFIGKQLEEQKRKRSFTATLGEFTVELKRIPGQKEIPGVLNMAEVTLVVECDTQETCHYVESQMSQARNLIVNVFVALERDELLSREGKRKIKKALVEKLNLWLPKGKVDNLYFSNLVVS